MKTLNNLGWMLLGVAVGSGALYCYNEMSCNDSVILTAIDFLTSKIWIKLKFKGSCFIKRRKL